MRRWHGWCLSAPFAHAAVCRRAHSHDAGSRLHPGRAAYGIAPPAAVAEALARGGTGRGGPGAAAALPAGAAGGNPPRTLSRRSGLQLEILAIYRALLRQCPRLTHEPTRVALAAHIRSEFRLHRTIHRKHVTLIEWHLQHARRKLDDLQRLRPNARFTVAAASAPPAPPDKRSE